MNFWNSYWFKPQNPIQLSLYRILMFGALSVVLPIHAASYLGYSCSEFQPIGFFYYSNFPCSDKLIAVVYLIGTFTSILASLGAFYWFTGKISAVAALIVFGYGYNFHEVYHGYHVYTMILLILSFSRAGDALCIFNRTKAEQHSSYAYNWPLRLCSTYVVYVYLLVGLQRLYFGGKTWIFSENFQLVVFANPYQALLRDWFLEQPLPIVIFLAFTSVVVCELAAPLALFHRYLGYLFWTLWACFHLGVTLLLGKHYSFFTQIIASSVFLLPLLEGTLSRRSKYASPSREKF